MILFPPFIVQFSTSFKTLNDSNQQTGGIISLIEKYLISNDIEKIAIEGNQLYFKYPKTQALPRGFNLIKVEGGVFNASFNNDKIIVRYTFNMVRSILTSLAQLLIIDLIITALEGRFNINYIYFGLLVIGIIWGYRVNKERFILKNIRKKIIIFLGSQ